MKYPWPIVGLLVSLSHDIVALHLRTERADSIIYLSRLHPLAPLINASEFLGQGSEKLEAFSSVRGGSLC